MRRQIKSAMTAALLCLLLSGCANSSPVPESGVSQPGIVSDPFESKPQSSTGSTSSVNSTSSVQVDSSASEESETSEPYFMPQPSAFTFGIHGDGNRLIDDATLTVPMMLSIGEESRAGVHVFLDGIPQKFCMEGESEKKYYNEYSFQDEHDEKYYPLMIEAQFDESLEKHTISGIGLGHVEFRPLSPNPNFVFYQLGMSPNSWAVDTSKNSVNYAKGLKIAAADAPKVMTQEQKTALKNGNSVRAAQKGGSPKATHFVLNPGETKLELELSCGTMRTTEPYIYRVSVYKNHELVKFNDGCDLIDMTCETRKCSTAEITIEDVKVGDFIYIIAVPIEMEGIGSIKSETCMITNPDMTF